MQWIKPEKSARHDQILIGSAATAEDYKCPVSGIFMVCLQILRPVGCVCVCVGRDFITKR